MEQKEKFFRMFLDSFGMELPKDEKLAFISCFQEQHFKKGDHITLEGEKNSFLGFIFSGLVRFYFNTFEGKEFNQTFKKENQLIADHYSFLTGRPAIFSIQALEPTTIYTANYHDMSKFYDQHRNWERIGRLIVEHNFIIKTERENHLLTLDAEGRYKKFLEDFKDFHPRISQMDIALYIGVNPSTLNRLIKKNESSP